MDFQLFYDVLFCSKLQLDSSLRRTHWLLKPVISRRHEPVELKNKSLLLCWGTDCYPPYNILMRKFSCNY